MYIESEEGGRVRVGKGNDERKHGMNHKVQSRPHCKTEPQT